ncbi:hypothetical protein [Alkalihalobacillus trypoxylicola]|uniref:Uncharacterized protein n=1 Tax=Alkalihalobacillus trypoxylicola TaxID=519424 RepID=A0A161QA40_9BACI|nr:hypothetical protein [Alkalihalobacillus trypoxylicola]KYG34331.1 hypothetical protein AZF04_14150 [Alkalihalobacillus trypoxylicola]
MSSCGCGGYGYDSDYGNEKGWESDVIKVSYNGAKGCFDPAGNRFPVRSYELLQAENESMSEKRGSLKKLANLANLENLL